jgi:hypothetical protein
VLPQNTPERAPCRAISSARELTANLRNSDPTWYRTVSELHELQKRCSGVNAQHGLHDGIDSNRCASTEPRPTHEIIASPAALVSETSDVPRVRQLERGTASVICFWQRRASRAARANPRSERATPRHIRFDPRAPVTAGFRAFIAKIRGIGQGLSDASDSAPPNLSSTAQKRAAARIESRGTEAA